MDLLLAELLLVLQELPVRAVQRVQPTQQPVVAVELLVVEVVEVGVVVQVEHPRPAVAAVVELGAQHRKDSPAEDAVGVRSADNRTEGQRQRIRDEHLDGVAVGGHQANRSGELVVDLVDPRVHVHAEDLAVQHPVGVEEDQLVKNDKEEGLEEHAPARGQLCREFNAEARVLPHQAAAVCVRHYHKDLANQDVLADLPQLRVVEPLAGLDPKLVEHLRSHNPVHQQKEETVHPVCHDGEGRHPDCRGLEGAAGRVEMRPPLLSEA
mmetsp:Transcript_9837/g.26699  ORF Transcript_9837/g.26699 Transcript_9837/m.26699 type:complete len:266 (+) Transcript_9837:116-913(+)